MDFIFLAGTFIRHLSGSQFWNNQAGHLYTGDLRKAVESLNGYARLIALAKAEDWKSAGMQELMERFNLNGQSPIQALQQLSKELDRLDLRNNQFLYVLLEGSIFSSFRKSSA